MFTKTGFLVLLALSFGGTVSSVGAQESQPFKLGAEHREFNTPAEASYPAYPAYGAKYGQVTPPPPPPPPKKLNGNLNAQRAVQPPPPPPRPPIQGNINRTPPPMIQPQAPQNGYLPPQFLGVWQVLGSRSGVEAQQQYQQGIDSIFSATTANTWKIQGNPQQGYMLSTDTGVSTALTVQTQGNTAILRYQHPIKNTMAQEALVMQLQPGGAQFDGLERISIVKQGEPQPRAKVTYKLIGRRQ